MLKGINTMKALLVKSFRELPTITACISLNKQCKSNPLYVLKVFCVNYFENRKIEYLQKIKKILIRFDYSNCESVYFGKSKRSLKLRPDKHKKSVRNSDCKKNKILKSFWEADHDSICSQKFYFHFV